MPLNAGDLDREVTIQQLADSDGSSGFPVETWTTLDTVWAQKTLANGSERFKTAQLAAALVVGWNMYWRDDLDPDSVDVPKTRRLLYQGRVYDITYASEIGRREGIELMTIARSGLE